MYGDRDNLNKRLDRLCEAWWTIPRGRTGDERRNAIEAAIGRLDKQESTLIRNERDGR